MCSKNIPVWVFCRSHRFNRFIMYCNVNFRPLEDRFVAMKVQCPFALYNLQLLIIKHTLVNKNVSKHQKQHFNVYDLTFNHLFLPEQAISHHWRLKLIFKPKLRFPQQPQSKQTPFHLKRPGRRALKRWCVWGGGFSSFVPDISGSEATFCPGWDSETRPEFHAGAPQLFRPHSGFVR